MSRIALVTDAAPNQTNGVVRTNREMVDRLRKLGHDIVVLTLDTDRFYFSMPFYPEIKLQFMQNRRIARELDRFKPDFIHIVTEGPLGLAARDYCLKRRHAFTTAFHTNYPLYLPPRIEDLLRRLRLPVSVCQKFARVAGLVTARYLRWFHAPSSSVMVATEALKKELTLKGYRHLNLWSRGVDLDQFQPYGKDLPAYQGLPRPIYVVHGRVALEKSLEDFLGLDLQGTKIVIGDGPALPELQRRFPDAVYTGMRKGVDLARHIAGADIYVMPSRSETFGLVLLEAIACGLPVAAYNTPINREIRNRLGSDAFCLDDNLGRAVVEASKLNTSPKFDPASTRLKMNDEFNWDASVRQFQENLRENTMRRRRKLQFLSHIARPFRPWRLLGLKPGRYL